MKTFNFKSPPNSKEAVKLASGRATFLAGGMSLIPAIKLRLAAYSDLINIKKINYLILIDCYRSKNILAKMVNYLSQIVFLNL